MALRYLVQFLLLLGIFLLGQWFVSFFHIPLPGSIVGMLLLFFALVLGIFKTSWFEQVAQLHLKHIVLLFIPPIVSIFHYMGVFKTNGLKLAIIITLSSLAVLFVTAFAVEKMETKEKKKKEDIPYG